MCKICFADDHMATEARQREIQARLDDGSLFDELRAELAKVEQDNNPVPLANAVAFLELFVNDPRISVPLDLRDFAKRHRGPAA